MIRTIDVHWLLFMGSTDIETCSVRSQVEHSNVRTSKPRSPGAARRPVLARRFDRSAHHPCPYSNCAGFWLDDLSRDFQGTFDRPERPRRGGVDPMGRDRCAASCSSAPKARGSPSPSRARAAAAPSKARWSVSWCERDPPPGTAFGRPATRGRRSPAPRA